MRIERSLKLINLSVWCLLSIWLAFGACELAEASELLDEILAEDATHQDLDEQALVQLGSGIRSAVPAIQMVCCVSSTAA